MWLKGLPKHIQELSLNQPILLNALRTCSIFDLDTSLWVTNLIASFVKLAFVNMLCFSLNIWANPLWSTPLLFMNSSVRENLKIFVSMTEVSMPVNQGSLLSSVPNHSALSLSSLSLICQSSRLMRPHAARTPTYLIYPPSIFLITLAYSISLDEPMIKLPLSCA